VGRGWVRADARRGLSALVLGALLASLMVVAGSTSAWAASVPGAPTARTVPGNGFVLAAWKAPASNGGASITAYQVGSRVYSTTRKAWSSWSYTRVGATARSHKVVVRNGTLVQTRVRAYNRLGASKWSATGQARAGTPTSPPTTSATAGSGRVTVAWGLPAANGSSITSYAVQSRSLVSGKWSSWTTRTVKPPTRTLTITGLVNGRSYQFRVRAANRWGFGPFGTTVSAKPGDTTAPAAVTGLSVGARTASSIHLSWSNPSDADLAAVVVRVAAGATPPTASGGTVVQSSLATSATATGLAQSTQYSFAVFARDAVGNLSSAATITTTTTSASGLQAVSTRADGSFSPEPTYSSVFSPDGTKVAMYTLARLLPDVDPERSSPNYDVYIKDLVTGAVTLASRRPDGTSPNGESGGPVWSPDGTKVAFYSYANNLLETEQVHAHIYVYDLVTQGVNRVDNAWTGGEPNGSTMSAPTWSPDGEWIAFSTAADNMTATGDYNTRADIFAAHPDGSGTILVTKNMVTGAYSDQGGSAPVYAPTMPLRLLYTTSSSNIVGGGGEPKLVVTYQEPFASVRVDETLTATGNNYSYDQVWSPDGTKVAFASDASNLALNDTNNAGDIFVAVPGDRDPVRLSQSSPTVGGDGGSQRPTWVGNGAVAFETSSTNLGGDSSSRNKVILVDLASSARTLISSASDGSASNGHSFYPTGNATGTLVAFVSQGTNVVPGDTSEQDVYVKHLDTGATVRVSETPAGVGGNGVSGTIYAPMSWSPVADELLFTTEANNLVSGDPWTRTWDLLLWRS